MKYRNQFLKYKLQSVDPEDGAAGGGGAGGGEGGAANAGQGGENNNQGDLQTFDDLWDNPSNDSGDAGNNAGGASQQQSGQQLSADEQFQAHVASIDFGVDPAAMFQAAQSGNSEGFAEQMQKLTSGIYKAAMLNSNKMLNQRMESMRDEMRQTTQSAVSSDKLISQMNERIPFTKDPAYAPMAKAVLTRLLNKGESPEKAIAGTERYFRDLAKQVPGSTSGKGKDVSGNGEADSQEMDWVSFMGGKPT